MVRKGFLHSKGTPSSNLISRHEQTNLIFPENVKRLAKTLVPMFLCLKHLSLKKYVTMLSMSKTSNISYFNYLFNNYTLCCQTDIVRLIHTTSSDHCSYNGNHLILDIIQCNHRLLSSFYKPLIILCNLWTSPYRG
mgnify:CR=1 FL=1